MLVTKLFCNQHFCKRSNNQLSYITFKTCFEISAVTPFGNYLGQLTLLFLRKIHFFGHTALVHTHNENLWSTFLKMLMQFQSGRLVLGKQV